MENIKARIHEEFIKLKSNKEEYFNTFYSNNYNLVYRICFSILKNKDNSEDVAQTVFEKIYKMPSEKIASEFESTWLYTVAKNEVIQFIRKNNNNLPLDDQLYEIEDKNNNINDIIENEEYNSYVKKLDSKQEQIVSMKVVSKFTFKEIGQILSMPTATVQWHYYKSINYLRLAIGNLAMFVVALSIGIRQLFKKEEKSNESVNNKTKEYDNYYSSSSESQTSENSTSKSVDSIMNSLPRGNTIESTGVADKCGSSFMPNMVTVGIFSVAGIFLTLTIIFSILCIKRKHKRI